MVEQGSHDEVHALYVANAFIVSGKSEKDPFQAFHALWILELCASRERPSYVLDNLFFVVVKDLLLCKLPVGLLIFVKVALLDGRFSGNTFFFVDQLHPAVRPLAAVRAPL